MAAVGRVLFLCGLLALHAIHNGAEGGGICSQLIRLFLCVFYTAESAGGLILIQEKILANHESKSLVLCVAGFLHQLPAGQILRASGFDEGNNAFFRPLLSNAVSFCFLLCCFNGNKAIIATEIHCSTESGIDGASFLEQLLIVLVRENKGAVF